MVIIDKIFLYFFPTYSTLWNVRLILRSLSLIALKKFESSFPIIPPTLHANCTHPTPFQLPLKRMSIRRYARDDISARFLLSIKFSSTLIGRRKARDITTLALIALPTDSVGFRSTRSKGQLSRDTRENLHLESWSWRKSTRLSFAPAFPLSGIGASRSLPIRNELEGENRYGDLLRRGERRSVHWTDNSG